MPAETHQQGATADTAVVLELLGTLLAGLDHPDGPVAETPLVFAPYEPATTLDDGHSPTPSAPATHPSRSAGAPRDSTP